jgi:hypothetical protein
LEDAASECQNDVLIEVKLLLFPIAQKLLNESVILKKRLTMNLRLLDLLTDDEHRNDQPSFRNDLRGMRGSERRNEVLSALRAELEHLTFSAPPHELNELTLCKSALTALRSDPQAELPKV